MEFYSAADPKAMTAKRWAGTLFPMSVPSTMIRTMIAQMIENQDHRALKRLDVSLLLGELDLFTGHYLSSDFCAAAAAPSGPPPRILSAA